MDSCARCVVAGDRCIAWAALLSLPCAELQPCLNLLLEWLSQRFPTLDCSQQLLALQVVQKCATEVRGARIQHCKCRREVAVPRLLCVQGNRIMVRTVCEHRGVMELLGQLTREQATTAEGVSSLQQLACNVLADICKAATTCTIEIRALRQLAGPTLAANDHRQQMLGIAILEHLLLGRACATEAGEAGAATAKRPKQLSGGRQRKGATSGLRKPRPPRFGTGADEQRSSTTIVASAQELFAEWLSILVWGLGHANCSIRERCWEMFDTLLKERNPGTLQLALRSMLTSGCVAVAMLHQADNHSSEELRLALQALKSMLRQASVRSREELFRCWQSSL